MPIRNFFQRKQSTPEEDKFDRLRKWMVSEQIESRGIRDKKVLDAMRRIPRHLFIPEKYQDEAYDDHPVSIGEGQTVSQPFVVAYMTEVLKIKKGDKVLEIGTGSGYQTAILAELTPHIYSIEFYKSLADSAKNILEKLGYTTVHVKHGNGYEGWKEYAPFDAIIGTCAPSSVPDKLLNQLNEKGRMVLPVGDRFSQDLVLIEKKNQQIHETSLIPVIFVPMLETS